MTHPSFIPYIRRASFLPYIRRASFPPNSAATMKLKWCGMLATAFRTQPVTLPARFCNIFCSYPALLCQHTYNCHTITGKAQQKMFHLIILYTLSAAPTANYDVKSLFYKFTFDCVSVVLYTCAVRQTSDGTY